MSTIIVLSIISSFIGLAGPSINVDCNNIDDTWPISEIAHACHSTAVQCAPGYQLPITDLHPGDLFIQNIKEIRCRLLFHGKNAKIYVFKSLTRWEWTGESRVHESMEELSFPALRQLKGDKLNIAPSASLKVLDLSINLRSSLKGLHYCKAVNMDMEHLLKVLKPLSIYECSVKKPDENNENEEMSGKSSSTWWIMAIIAVATIIPLTVLSILAFVYRKDIYPAYYYLIQRINGIIERIQKKRGKPEATVAYQPEAEEEEEAAPSAADEDLTAVPTSSLRRGDLLGKGGFGAIYRVDHPTFGVTAAKWYHLEEEDSKKKMVRRGRRESHYGLELRGHPHIVHTLAAIHEDTPKSPIGILCELMEGGDIWTNIKEHPDTPVELRNKWAVDLAKAIEFVHQKRLMHRDIKPTNVLLSASRTTAKLASFGLMTQVSRGKKHQQGIGNLLYTAPEVFLSKNYGRAVDVYSFGLTVYYLFYGRDPYNLEDYPFGFFSSISAVAIQDEVNRPDLIGIPVDEIIVKCWKGVSEERSRMEEVLTLLDGPEGRLTFPRIQD